ncbi:inositol monophosphatase [Planotetraspora sp. A-T 1434]|uniref:inositol monophosphatase family protein n=1 Tax=Planotetraspora sp. A-T 1434 TaxID=2979219 RepID=UPI0021BEED3F|nr:inositol monophosphatase family protein [Planotetraspora sp. A-T 1434]MCT9932162.1 inositol monophosphatase [Planotetraspora sp. A-T 1434]
MSVDRILDVAVRAAQDAGGLIRDYAAGDGIPVDYKGGFEPVTIADLAADGLIRDAVAAAFPGHRVLTEETAGPDWSRAGFDGPLWIVDPIDGTANYARGHRYVSVSIAYAEDGVVRAGVVHAPFLGETFTAVKGRGAFLNGTPIRVGAPESLKRSIVSTGFPHDKTDVEPLVERVRRLLIHCQDIMRGSSPALDIAWTACGRLDAHTEALFPWDVAAAGLIATEAGARRGSLLPVPDGIPPDLYGEAFIVAAPAIYDELVTLLSG